MNRVLKLPLVLLILLSIGLLGDSAQAGEQRRWEAGAEQGRIRLEARYTEDHENGLVDQFLDVRLDNASRNTVFTVSINGRMIGRFTTDADGNGRFHLEVLDAEADENGRPIGARINTGDRITISHGRFAGSAVFVPA